MGSTLITWDLKNTTGEMSVYYYVHTGTHQAMQNQNKLTLIVRQHHTMRAQAVQVLQCLMFSVHVYTFA